MRLHIFSPHSKIKEESLHRTQLCYSISIISLDRLAITHFLTSFKNKRRVLAQNSTLLFHIHHFSSK
nr:MAG TPA: hypothetical protein [Bacteriophage sp.]